MVFGHFDQLSISAIEKRGCLVIVWLVRWLHLQAEICVHLQDGLWHCLQWIVLVIEGCIVAVSLASFSSCEIMFGCIDGFFIVVFWSSIVSVPTFVSWGFSLSGTVGFYGIFRCSTVVPVIGVKRLLVAKLHALLFQPALLGCLWWCLANVWLQ